MRFVHTSDWHAGRIWKRMSRLDELEATLGSLVRFVESDKIDAVLMTGDVFDSGTPSADAEKLVFDVFKRLGRNCPVLVLAGNHDDPRRLEAWGQLAELVQIRTLARPRRPADGGVWTLPSRDAKESAIIAAVPFAQLRDFVTAADVAGDEGAMRSKWNEGLAKMVTLLAGSFRGDTINILAAHTHVEGAVLARSEREVHVGQEWALASEQLPRTAQYVALGHIHKPQTVRFGVEYAGSPIQMDFGEEGETKSFVVIDVHPGLPPVITRVPYEGGVPLVTWEGTLAGLASAAEGLRGPARKHVRLKLLLDAPDGEIAQKVRALVPNVVGMQLSLPEADPALAAATKRSEMSASELFAAYHLRQYKRAADPALVEAFAALWEASDLSHLGGGAAP